jgi:hypothetical protein
VTRLVSALVSATRWFQRLDIQYRID